MIESPKANVGNVDGRLSSLGDRPGSGNGSVSAADRSAFESALERTAPLNSGASTRQGVKTNRSLTRHDLETGSLRKEESRETRSSSDDRSDDFETDPDSVMRFFEGTTPGLPRDLQSRLAADALADPVLDSEALEALVSKILVSAPKEGGSEVRLYLSDTTLAGTEIILRRDNAGLLSVRCVTADPSAFQTLVGAQADLRAKLEETEGEGVAVTVEEGGSDQDAAGSQSRGRDDQNEEGGNEDFPS